MLPFYIRRGQPAGQVESAMAKVLQRVEITLRSFYIFNSSFGQKEGEVSQCYQYENRLLKKFIDNL